MTGSDRQQPATTVNGGQERGEAAKGRPKLVEEGRCDFFRGARVICGGCGKRQEFAKMAGGGGDTQARAAGWQIEWRPRPFVRCRDCRSAR